MKTIPFQIKDTQGLKVRFSFFYDGAVYTRTIYLSIADSDIELLTDSDLHHRRMTAVKKYIKLLSSATHSAARTLLMCAEKTPWENINCKNCIKCHGCVNCEHCENCIKCESCIACENCANCENCKNCIKCHDCGICKNCSVCNNSYYCNYCVKLNNCKHCFDCMECESCNSCKECIECANQTHKESLTFVYNS